MEPLDSGQEPPPEQGSDLSPSSKGRQRKKNSKYLDYETDYSLDAEGLQQKHPSKSPRGEKASPKKTPSRGRKPASGSQRAASEKNDESDRTAPEPDGEPPEEPPKRTPRARKTSTRRTPAPKAPAAGGGAQQQNGTPPKGKCGRKQRNQGATAASEPPRGEERGQPPAEEEAAGGRPRRGAAKAALKYLHSLATEMFDSQPGAKSEVTGPAPKTPNRTKVTKGQKRKRPDFDSDAPDDEDFVPGRGEEEEEEEELDETEDEESAESSDVDSDVRRGGSRPARHSRSFNNFKGRIGFTINTMKVVWECMEATKKFRQERLSSWVFADWVPSTSAWARVPQREVDTYLPEEPRSAAFRVSREGLRKEETPLRRLDRFGSVPVHPERWDGLLFAGGPVWAMEWCPTPDGVAASQFIALSCHRGMDERHHVNRTYTGPGLVQLWDVGRLEYNARPQSQPSLAYALAQDKGFIWQLKWCPAGGWEPPTSARKAPLLPRLGLLAVATSSSVVTIYSLPHPAALNSSNSNSENSSQQLHIYKAKGLVTLKLGAFKAPRLERSGQVLCMDWLPEKPHDIIVIGFYDGTVGLWNLSTKSSLLRIREPDASLSLLPYRCLLAHEHAVRALAFCPASRHLLVTAGEDRYVKTWDLRRPYDPITVQKRYLTNEIYWPLNGPGIILAQDCAYAPKSQGVHYLDHLFNSFFVIPRSTTVWSLSYTDWMNSVVACDSFGEVIFAVLPQLNSFPPYAKRTLERRLPIYLSSVLPDDKPGDHETAGGAEHGAGKAQEGSVREDSDAPSDKGNKQVNGDDGDGDGAERTDPSQPSETYKEALRRCRLLQEDFDLQSFVGMEKRALWKRMKNTEIGVKLDTDKMTIAALHKVRFNPNMNCHVWVASGGQTGLVKLNCLRGMISSESKKIVGDGRTRVNAQQSTNEQEDAGQSVTDEL
ncbi:general transcription factor 3C polypeptide 2 isoform X2 [Betta splendens]|uniref:General transcription factor 3C polypeptide 2 isoform X2 n=1 Tax=Betta splendens TaxID=158456 RepID=A0A6P7LRG6_BETSP|nr:general transcription factor 3C polypeptide 2 isoform X2 [Betta splendens]